MSMHKTRAKFYSAATVLFGLALSPFASAQTCCPSGGVGAPKAASGLGDALPPATDLAADPAWQVYQFERGGIRYIQINDQNLVPRAAVGQVGNVFWTLPIGKDVDRVSLPGDVVPNGQRKTIYRSADVEVVLYQDGGVQRWEIVSPDQSR